MAYPFMNTPVVGSNTSTQMSDWPALASGTKDEGAEVLYTAFALTKEPVTTSLFAVETKAIPLPVLLSFPMVSGEGLDTAPPELTQRKVPVAAFSRATKRSEVDWAM